jgi:hypothetical protein
MVDERAMTMTDPKKHLTDRVIRLAELARDVDVLDGFTFEGCHLEGPAVVILIENVTLTDNHLDGDRDALLWEIPLERRRVIGAIGLKNTTIRGSRLTRIGIAGSRDLLDQF